MGSNADGFNNSNLFLTAKSLKQGYIYHKFEKHFLNSELIVKYNIGLKTLLQQGILVYKFKTIVEKTNFSDQFKNTIKRNKNSK